MARARPVWSKGPRASILRAHGVEPSLEGRQAGRDAGRPIGDRGHGRADRVQIRGHAADLRADAAHLCAEAGEGLEAQHTDVHPGGQIVGGGADVASHAAQLRGQATELVDAWPRGFDGRDDVRERIRGRPDRRGELDALGLHASQRVIETDGAP